jgi:endonuclease G
VFTGHIFGNNDPQYRGIKLPKQYWKVVVIVKKGSNKLSATAYLLSQATLLRNLEDEAFSYGAYRTFQVPVKRIEALTDIQFGNLRSFDPLNNQEADVTREITELNEVIF